MEIKTTRDLGIWFTNIRECNNDIIMSNPKNLKYLYKNWVLIDDILKEIKTIDKWHSTHITKNLIKVLEDVISSNSSSDKSESFNKGYEVNQK